MRLGKFVEHFKAASAIMDAKGGDGVVKYLGVGRYVIQHPEGRGVMG